VLSYLVQHAGRLVTQNELLEAIWPDTFVQPEVLKNHVAEVRTALGDSAKSPLFIETLPRRGYRFIRDVTETPGEASVSAAAMRGPIIGRERELEVLRGYLNRARGGEQQVVFVTGEAGLGKTTLADAFTQMEEVSSARISRSQCVERYGVQEPYYPMLVALGKLLREDQELVKVFATHAPTWLVQFPGLLTAEQRQALQREILGATPERMLREFCDVLPLMAPGQCLLLLLEDVHWADAATVDLISTIAHSRSRCKLMLVATYRPVEVVLSQHPLRKIKQDLAVRGLCQELAIEPLDQAGVARYLIAQSPDHGLPPGLAELAHRFSDGNPLFLRAVIDHLIARGQLSRAEEGWKINVPIAKMEAEAPDSLRQMLEIQVERVSRDERQALEAASVCGVSFLAQVAGTAGGCDVERYEEICDGLAQSGQILQAAGAKNLRNGTVTPRYKFANAMYRRTIYDRLPPQRRSRLHLRAADSLEALYAESPAEVAAELALHFEAGGDWNRAARYFQLVAENKGQRFAYGEAASDLERVMELLARLPEEERAAREIEVMQKLGAIYFALEDFPRAIAILETVAKRAALAQDSRTEINVLIEMGIVLGRASAAEAVGLARCLLKLSERQQDPILRARARMGALLLQSASAGASEQDAQRFRGELAQVRSRMDRPALAAHATEYACFQLFSSEYQDSIKNIEESLPVLIMAGDIRHRAAVLILIMSLIFAGNWDKALGVAQDAVASAQRNGNHSREYALRLYEAWPHLLAHDWSGALELCEAAIPMLQDPYQAVFLRQGLILAGTALIGLGRHELAGKYLAQAREQMEAQPVEMDWYWKMPLESALTELSLKRGNLEQARIEAGRFVEISQATAERTWQALAWEASARVAIAGFDLQDGQRCIRNAIAAMEGFDLPVAFWRVHATAMQVFLEATEEHKRFSAGVIGQLAESLQEFPSLQDTFLSSELVRSVSLRKAAAVPWQEPRLGQRSTHRQSQ